MNTIETKLVERFYDVAGAGAKLIFLTKFGSHLYGTDSPDSDTDYVGVFLPDPDSIVLGDFPKELKLDTNKTNTKNTSSDVDCSFISIQKYLKEVTAGETRAMDILHALSNKEAVALCTEEWLGLYAKRSHLHTSKLKAFVGYAKKQADKYGLKGSRIAAARQVHSAISRGINRFGGDAKMFEIWDELPVGDHQQFHPVKKDTKVRMYTFCGTTLQETAKLQYCLDIAQRFIDKFGARAREAERNEGIDWKAMSHAYRAAYQIEEIFDTGDLKFPLRGADGLKEIKQGLVDFRTTISFLEYMIDDLLDNKSKTCGLPDEPDPQGVVHKYVAKLLINQIAKERTE